MIYFMLLFFIVIIIGLYYPKKDAIRDFILVMYSFMLGMIVAYMILGLK